MTVSAFGASAWFTPIRSVQGRGHVGSKLHANAVQPLVITNFDLDAQLAADLLDLVEKFA